MNKEVKFINISEQIKELIEEWYQRLIKLSENDISGKKNFQNRTVREIMGHLIDSASNNHQRITRLQYNSKLDFPDYRQDNDQWIKIQNFQDENWIDLLNLWKYYNIHLTHIFKNIDNSKLKNTWTDFEGNVVTLEEMVTSYLFHINLHFGEIEELLTK